MTAEASKLAADRDLLLTAEAKGSGAKLKTFDQLSGPGWLQSALTLGGGTLAGSLYLGVLSGSTSCGFSPWPWRWGDYDKCHRVCNAFNPGAAVGTR